MKKSQKAQKQNKTHDAGLERAVEIAEMSLEYARDFVKRNKLKLGDDEIMGLAQYLLELRNTYAPIGHNKVESRDRSTG